MSVHICRSRARRTLFIPRVATIVALFFSHQAAAQERLGGGSTTLTASPAFESWSFSNGGMTQPTIGGTGNVFLSSVTQLSIPVVLSIPFLENRWSVDVSGGFSSNKVSLAAPDGDLGTSSYSLSGLTDAKLRVNGRLAGESILLTLGVNIPTGKTELDEEELSALRVIAAPALNLQIPYLGSGGGGTAGLVLARQFSDWAWALGASYELRTGYTPISFSGGVPSPDFNPGDVIHISLGGDGLVGNSGMSVGLSADIFSDDELSSGGSAPPGTRLGPIFTAEWRLQFASTRFEELALSLVDRYRTPYKRDGSTVDGSSANYLDVALTAAHSPAPRTTLTWELSAHHHTGLKADSALISAAMSGAGLRLSLARQLQGGSVLQPYAGIRFMNLESGNNSGSATGVVIGVTVLQGW